MGVNALAVNVGTEEEIRIQLEHLVVRKKNIGRVAAERIAVRDAGFTLHRARFVAGAPV